MDLSLDSYASLAAALYGTDTSTGCFDLTSATASAKYLGSKSAKDIDLSLASYASLAAALYGIETSTGCFDLTRATASAKYLGSKSAKDMDLSLASYASLAAASYGIDTSMGCFDLTRATASARYLGSKSSKDMDLSLASYANIAAALYGTETSIGASGSGALAACSICWTNCSFETVVERSAWSMIICRVKARSSSAEVAAFPPGPVTTADMANWLEAGATGAGQKADAMGRAKMATVANFMVSFEYWYKLNVDDAMNSAFGVWLQQ